MSFEALMSVGSELWSTLVASNNVHCPLRKRTSMRRSLQYRFRVQEAGKNIKRPASEGGSNPIRDGDRFLGHR